MIFAQHHYKMLKRIFSLLALAAITSFAAPLAFGQDGTLGATNGTVAGSTAAAQTNESEEHEHHKKCEELKHEAYRHPEADGEPNHELMEQSRHEAHLARQSGGQAQEFAREALQALTSRSAQTNQGAAPAVMSDGQPVDIAYLQKLAGQPVTGVLSNDFGTGHSGFQDLSSESSLSAAAPGLGDAAASAASATAKLPGGNSASTAGVTAGGAGTLDVTSTQIVSAGQPLNANKTENSSELKAISLGTPGDPGHIVTKADGIIDKKTLDANRARVLKQMGVRGPASVEESGPIRAKNEDIFQLVHTRYKSLNDNGAFYDGAPPPPTPGPSRNPPAYTRGI
jgi:hypothetical protein